MLQRSGLAIALILWVPCLTPSVVAEQPPAPASAQEEADHQALRDLRPAYEQAIRDNNIEMLRPHLHADFHGVMVTGRLVNSFDELQQFWRDIKNLIGEGGSYTTTLNPERSVIAGDLALARGTTDDVVVTSDGDEFRFTTMWSATLQRDGGAWKIRYVQGTMDPIANPFVREFSRRAVTRMSAAALLAGVIVGLAFGLIWQRRRTRRAGATR
jgi:ketosteroid isomerase-like protein